MASGAALELAGVGKSYGRFQKKRALQGISLRVERGECFGLAGANGAGKTTLIRILLGLMDPDEGEAWLLGERPEDPEVRRRVGFVPESATLPETASPRALVRRWARLRGLAAAPALKQGLETLDRLGMEGLLDRPSGKLSKGERQRTLLALAMLGSPELLVLDEPTDGLDPLGRAKMREVIRAECDAGKTVFLNSHLLAETERICTRVGILHRGQLVRVETLAGARSSSGPATSAIVLASALTPEQLVRARVQPAPEGSLPVRDLLTAGATVLVPHADLQGLNEAIDRLRAEGALLVEVRRVKADLEAALAEVVDGSPANANALGSPSTAPTPLSATSPAPSSAIAPTSSLAVPTTSLATPTTPQRPRPLRALVATVRVAQEIAADLASRKIGWFALGAALLATFAFMALIRSDIAQGAAAGARQFGANGLTSPKEVAAFIGGFAAKFFYWSGLLGGVLLAAVFTPSLLEPRRTILLYSQPITRADYALGIWAATCTLTFLTCELLFVLAWCSLRWLDLAAPWTFMLAPLIWMVAYAALLALQLLAVLLFRNALFTGAVGLGLLIGTAVLNTGFNSPLFSTAHRGWGLLYALLPRTVDLMEQAHRISEGHGVRALALLPTLGLLVAYLVFLRVLASRSEP